MRYIKPLCFLMVTAFALPSIAVTSNSGFARVPVIATFSFTGTTTKLIVGTSTENVIGFNCNSGIKPADTLGNLALVSTFYQNGCYTNGTFNHNNYTVSSGKIADRAGLNNFVAYKIGEPAKKATNFIGSPHVVYYKFPTVEDYSIYSLNSTGNEIRLVAKIPAASITRGQFVKIAALNASAIKGSAIYAFVPSSQRVSNFALLGTDIEGALVNRNAIADVNKFLYKVGGQPYDTKTGFNVSPNNASNIYGLARQFFIVFNAAQNLGIIWQDKLNNTIKLTWIGAKTFATTNLSNTRNELLAAATFDGLGNLYYLTVQTGNGAPNTDRTATLYKTTDTGTLVLSKNLDTSKTGLNMVEFFKVASLDYANGNLALMLGRKMHLSSDGVNHQGGIAVVYNANTLAQVKNWGQTSGHSFDNVLISNSANQFISIDLGDNFPRGVNLHQFTAGVKASRVVYTYKTKHGTTASNPSGTYPAYPAISTGAVKYFKWSNDNNTYTELGGVVESADGYSVFFAGEPNADGKALDVTRVGGVLNDARDIGMVKVIKNFPAGSSTVVSDALMLTKGIIETGGYYGFTGGWSPQRNAGVVWLTNYVNKAATNASRLKAVKITENKILLLWELWSQNAYVNTFAMTVNSLGAVLSPAVALGTQVRLNRRDDPFVSGNNVYLVSGNKFEGKLELIEIKVK